MKTKNVLTAINIISWISILAIVVVSAALIIVFSVFNGFEGLVKNLYSDFYASIYVLPSEGKSLKIANSTINQLKSIHSIEAVSSVVEEKALLINGDYQTIVVVKGVDNQYKAVNALAKHVDKGEYDLGTVDKPKLLIGAGIENILRIDYSKLLAPLTIYLPKSGTHQITQLNDVFNSYTVYPMGSFAIQQDFDNKYVFTNISFLKFMLNMESDEYSSLEIKVAAKYDIDKTAQLLQKTLGNNYIVKTRYQQNQSLYTAMQVEKWVIYGITCLILVIAAFNIIGSLSMLVLEKQKDIALLIALGATTSMIQSIFFNVGVLIAIIGSIVGVSFGTIVCMLQMQTKFIKLSGGSFIIDYYPVKLLAMDYIVVITTVLVIAIMASFLPARQVNQLNLSLKK